MITRRDALTWLLASPLGFLLPGRDAAPAPRTLDLLTVPVAGFQHHAGREPSVVNGLATGSPLALRREPDNPHDADAIALHIPGGPRIGYVPRSDNAVFAALLDGAADLSAVVARYEPELRPWERLDVALRLTIRA